MRLTRRGETLAIGCAGLALAAAMLAAFLAGEERRCQSLREQGSVLVQRYCEAGR